MKVFINSVPKSGTNLVEKLVRMAGCMQANQSLALSSVMGKHSVIKQMTRVNTLSDFSISIGLPIPVGVKFGWLKQYISKVSDDKYLSGHAAYSEQLDHLLLLNNIKTLQVYRDPRAVLVSSAKYMIEDINRWYPFQPFLKQMNLQDRIRFLLVGGEVGNGLYYSSFKEVLQRSAGWLDSDNALVVRFEDLVGAKGGGRDLLQRETIVNVLEHIGSTYQAEELDRMQIDLYGGTHTFRSGQIDGWKENISNELNELILHELKDCTVVRKLGYGT